jgi:hypothetical protein
MRSSMVAVIVALMCAVGVASAQTVGVLDWGQEHPENLPTASWLGSTGLILTPSATIGDAVKLSGGYHRVDGDVQDLTAYNANLAISANIEVGVARLTNVTIPAALGDEFGDETVFNAKAALDLANWFKVFGGPDVAVGVWDASDKVNRAIYVVASKKFNLVSVGLLSDFTAHVGFGDTEQNYGALDGLFGGIEMAVMSGALLQVEYDAQDINAALHYYPTPQLSLDLGVLDGDLGFGASFRTTY